MLSSPFSDPISHRKLASREEPSFLEALVGVLRTTQLEYPKLWGQLIDVEGEPEEKELLALLRENEKRPYEPHIRYRDGKRWVRQWLEVETGGGKPRPYVLLPWKEDGCYLITGGAGGLARLFVQEIAQQVQEATVILVGRSALSLEQYKQLEQKENPGIHIDYQQVDVNDGAAVHALIQRALAQYGHLNGIIHAAGVLRDNLLLNKTPEGIQEVLAPKVAGVEHLDEASAEIPLDFFILCSSLAAVVGNVGQADYAAANGYMDTFARARRAQVMAGQRQGATVSINWPHWETGGMQIESVAKQTLQEQLGMEPLGREAGMQSLYQALALGQAQVIVLHGDLPKLQKRLLRVPSQDYASPAQAPTATDQEELREKTLYQMKVLFAEVTKLDLSEIDADEPLENYGIDSLMITHLTQKLLALFQDFPRTLLYEYPTLSTLVEYLLESYPQECMQWTGQLPNTVQITTHERVGTGQAQGTIPTTPVQKGMPATDSRTGAVGIVPCADPVPACSSVSSQTAAQTSIAIIGISGRYPQASNLEEYWEILKAGQSCITEIPPARWDWKDYYQNNREQAIAQGKSYSKWGAFLADFDQFDPLFFHMTPREAEEIDPQERLFLEECWKALEDAGYAPSTLSPALRQRTGVFGGITKQGFHLYSAETPGQFPSTSFASLVNRVSYHLNLQGPSTVVDTMCSSSLVAIHEACEYIRQGKGAMALAGGVNLYVHPSTYIGLSRSQTISDSEKCVAFGKGGTGFVPGEGVGVIVLKAYDQAIKDGDGIYAVIRGSAVNHNGRTKSYTTPDPSQQAAVIQQALEQSRLDPRTISYIEAAASGSEVADPVEMAALTRVFGQRESEQGEYKIGSVKNIVGHSEAASGMAQLTKVILSLQQKTLVPTGVPADFHPTTPVYAWPFQLQREISLWKRLTIDGLEVPRRAGITSVGAGGVNAHLIVEEYIPETEPAHQSTDPTAPILFVLSAKNKERLSEYVKQWIAYLRKNQNVDIANVAYTLQIGREAMPCRLAIMAHHQEELVRQLEQWIGNQKSTQNCYFSERKAAPDERNGQVTETSDLGELAQIWVAGNAVSWNDLHQGKQRVRITGLPTYPFKRRTCWIDRQNHENKAVEFYTLMAEKSNVAPVQMPVRQGTGSERGPGLAQGKVPVSGTIPTTPEVHTEYLTFCPFEEKVPGFSMSQVFLHSEKHPDEIRRIQAKQTEMRQVLFCQEDFQQVHTLFDIGCGHGTDVIQIARLYPHITTHGFTITQAQAELGERRIAELNLSSQAQIWQKDSSKDAFPAKYDLIIGIEVTFHIRNKAGLFQNIASSLNEHGKVLLADYVANLRGAIVDPQIEISIPTQREWLDLLTEHHLIIDEIIDVSPQIANFLDDPEVRENVKDLPKVAQDTYISYANQAVSLAHGWINYCLFKLKKDTQRNTSERRNYNESKIVQKTPYPQALADMLKRGHIPYPQNPAESARRDSGQGHRDGQDRRDGQGQAAVPTALSAVRSPLPTSIKGDLREIFLSTLKLQPSDLEEAETFQDLGIGSINIVQLLEAINSKYNLRLPTSILFECKNIDALVDYINAEAKLVPAQDLEPVQNVGAGLAPAQDLESSQEESNPRTNLTTHDQVISDDIAIIGLSLRCAEAETQDEFWDLVSQGKSGIQDITQKNWLDFFKAHSLTNLSYRYGRMKNVACFDPLFFHISPHEAEMMNVSQRILLEECYKALEDAGYPPSSLSGQQVATLIGSMGITPAKTDFSHFSLLGSELSILASRIAYFLNLKGPALAIDTACSSSLVAIDIACQQLKSHTVDLTIVGGITIYSHPGAFLSMRNAGMLSPTGECRPFDQAADGIVVGDGVGILILKRLQDAERDGDHIYGVIQASGTNQDGQTSGITVPSFQSQSRLQETIYRRHHINVEDLQYIEAHGTATKLGDPIEIHALTRAFNQFTPKKGFCAIGSLKANIGHTGAAAGVLSIIKVLLSLKHQQIPPSINFSRENEHIDFANSPVYVNTALKPWPINATGSRQAAISSFGFSGTNAHLVISEYAAKPQRTGTVGVVPCADPVPCATGLPCPYVQINEATPGVLILSAETQEGLRTSARAIRAFLQQHAEVNLADLLYTLQIGRESMTYRLALVITSKEMLITQLAQFVAGENTGALSRWARKINKNESLIGDTEEGQEFMQKLIEHKKLAKLADLWLHGNEISWEGLYSPGSVKRLAGLPNYPFAHNRYEISEIDPVGNPVEVGGEGWSGEGLALHQSPDLPVEATSVESGQAQGAVPTDGLREARGQAQELGAVGTGLAPVHDPTFPTDMLVAVPSSGSRKDLDSCSLPPGKVYPPNPNESSGNALGEALKRVISRLLKVPVEEIDAETALSEYGFDSVTFTKFADLLNQTYQLDLTAPLFYEYSTVERLAQYLQVSYATILAPHFAVTSREVVNQQIVSDKVSPVRESPTIGRSSIATTASVPTQRESLVRSLVHVPDPFVAASPIAIIGMSGTFPMAPDVQSLWENLLKGRDCIGEIPPSRWDWRTYFGNTAATTNRNKTNVKWAGILEGIELFDPLFFGISPRKAEQMDPQQRLLMMYIWKAIEDAGYSAESLSGTNTALFVGTASSGYGERFLSANMAIEGHSATGLASSVGPNRMSYFLDLHGPSEPIETACSSSLVAIHRGVNVIESGQCSMSIVGGINTLVSPEAHISLSKAGMLCEDGRCKTFSAQANGYVRSEGVGMLVLKRLDLAEQAGDHIYGVIRGSAENHGGRASSLTAPNPKAQADLLITAYCKAGIDPRTVSYIEAHGTGTELGDPIEINGLKTAFHELAETIGEGPMQEAVCGIGSVKSNIGHLELAAGVAGVIKVLLQMQHKKLVKSLHCEQINPYIQLEGSPFYIVQENREWEALRDQAGNPLPRRAGVSSFGFGGVNAHVVLEEYVPKPQEKPLGSLTGSSPAGQAPGRGQAPPLLIVLSAKNEERLQEQVRQLLAWLQGMGAEQPLDLQELAYTLQVGREAMEERLALQISSLQELEEKLSRYLQDPQEGGDWYRGQVRRHNDILAFLSTDEEQQEAISKWFQRGKYDKILQGWVKGLKIEWRHLYTVGTGSVQDTTIGASPGSAQGTIPTAAPALPRRISLPTYPFARERYWFPIRASSYQLAFKRAIFPLRTANGLSLPCEHTDRLPGQGQAVAPTDSFFVRRLVSASTQGTILTGESTESLTATDGTSTTVALGGDLTRTLLLTPNWKEEEITSVRSEHPISHPAIEEGSEPRTTPTAPSLILLCDLPDTLASRLQAQMPLGWHCRSLHSLQPSRRERFQEAVMQLIQELQHLLQSQPTGPVLVQVVVAHREEPSFFEALVSVLKTAMQEYPKLRAQLIEVEGEPREEELLTWLYENQIQMPQEPHIRYRDGKRWVAQWQEVYTGEASSPTSPPAIPWKEGGCYLISGGAGGLARLFVQEIAQQVQEATIILVGRSALSQEQRAQLHSIGVGPRSNPGQGSSGIHIDYQQVDVACVPCATGGPTVHALIQRILQKSGHLNGIIHAAGVLRDSLLLNKTQEDVLAVLAPKVIGVEHLDEESRQIPLDFFILCSSLSAVAGHAGQADYAAANAYLDAFAHRRRAQVMAGERQGTTVSINWPLWEEGGMQIEAAQKQMMRDLLGAVPMGTKTGMKALYQALASGCAQVTVIHGQIERIKQQWLHRSPDLSVGVGRRPAPTSPVESTIDPGREGEQKRGSVSTDKLREALLHIVSDLLKVPVEQIDAELPLSEYGFDSITFTELANHLNQTYQLDLTPPLLFEHSTIERLVLYLQATYTTALAPHFAAASPEGVNRKDLAPVAPRLVPRATDKVPSVALMGRQRSRVARSRMYASEQKGLAMTSPIAIIGMSGMFPQAPDVQSLWSNLLEGRDCIGEIPASRWDWQTSFSNTAATEDNKTNVKWAGTLEDIGLFDPLFFGISPREAEQMDPQQRLLMMYVWKAIEDAGYSAESLSGTNTALFVGTGSSGYGERVPRANRAIEGHFSTGLAPSMGPNRMSYFLNLHGPSEPIETACSSSLIAIHRGVNAIESDQCSIAIVGGVNTIVSPELHISLSKAGMLCEDGHCKTFSASANGYVRGEGVGMLVLKRLDLAEQAGDHIYGVIRGSAENHGGRASSLTAPNPRAQADLLITAYRKAGIDPRTVSYIEAHGTGTPLGDPIEINGLKTAFSELSETIGKGPMQEAVCGIGSVKSNIGHLELAAGVAGVIKVLLQLQHKKLVKSLHCERLNPYIQLEGSPFYIVQENREWQALRDQAGNPLPRRAGVSSFGFGGANAHVVLEEYVPKPQAPHPQSLTQLPALIVFSAKNEERLREQVQQLLTWITVRTGRGSCPTCAEEPLELQELAYTLQVGREAMEERLALQVSSLQELSEKLSRYLQYPQEGRDWYRGQVRRHKDMLALMNTDEELQEAIDKWLRRGKYEKLLQGWVKGLKVEWRHLYGEHLPHRMSLPTYPFARERYWVPTATRLSGLSTRMLLENPAQPIGQDAGASSLGASSGVTAQSTPLGSTLKLSPLWDLVVLPQRAVALGDLTNQVVIVGGTPSEQSTITDVYPHARTLEIPTGASIEQIAQRLQEIFCVTCTTEGSAPQIQHLFWLAQHDPVERGFTPLQLTQESILAAQQQGVMACFRLIKALLQLGYGSQTLGFTVITRQTRLLHTTETGNPTHASLLGLFGSLAKEYSLWSIQQVDLPADAPLPLTEMLRLPADPQGHGWLYRNGHWYRQILLPLDVSSFETHKAYRRGGVYVIIGGAGGIGEVFSEHLIRRYQAQMIWIGRRKIDASIEAKREQLATLGPRPHYIIADATDQRALQRAYEEIKCNFGQIHGVVHSAIVLQDRSLANMDEERFQVALAAKVDVCVRLAQVFEQEPLDFVLFFSSLGAFTRNAGQSNYAAGCTFEDAFAARLGRDWGCAVKVMNWGYWGSVGVVAEPVYRERMAQMGVGSIEPEEAMEALEHLLAGPVDQMALLKTTKHVASGPVRGEEIIQTDEIITVYPKLLPSCIRSLWTTARDCPHNPTGETPNPNPDVPKEYTDRETQQEMQKIEEMLFKLLWSHLQSLGLFREKQVVLTNMREQAGISTSYDRWLQTSVALLERQHYLYYHNTICTVSDSPTQIENVTLWQDWDQHKEQWIQNANLKAQVVLVETMLRALPAILTGKRPAPAIMFPNGSMELVEGIYPHNVVADIFNEVLSRQVLTYIQERLTHERDTRIRILEIGAGTGGTTSRVLQMIHPYQASIAEYCYSDISEAFLRYGQQVYGVEHPYLTYRLFNVEKPLAGQGIELGSYDLVIATNVLHATSNIRRTIRNAKAALKKHGLLLLNEITGVSLVTHLTFGLLPGWWAYEDPELRVPGCPALTAESWQAVLTSEGFGVIYHPTREMQEASLQVIVAESDGVVRQPPVEQSLRLLPKAATVPVGIAPVDPSKGGQARGQTQGTVPTDKLREALLQGVSSLLRVPIEQVNAETALLEYGLDSLLSIGLANYLNLTYQLDLTSAVFSEHSTIERLTQYLQTTYAATLAPHFAAASAKVVAQQATPEPMIADAVPPNKTPPTTHTHCS